MHAAPPRSLSPTERSTFISPASALSGTPIPDQSSARSPQLRPVPHTHAQTTPSPPAPLSAHEIAGHSSRHPSAMAASSKWPVPALLGMAQPASLAPPPGRSAARQQFPHAKLLFSCSCPPNSLPAHGMQKFTSPSSHGTETCRIKYPVTARYVLPHFPLFCLACRQRDTISNPLFGGLLRDPANERARTGTMFEQAFRNIDDILRKEAGAPPNSITFTYRFNRRTA